MESVSPDIGSGENIAQIKVIGVGGGGTTRSTA